MSTIEWSDYSDLRNSLYKSGDGKEEMKALPSLPSKDQLKNVFQTVEDKWEEMLTKLKADVDSAYGQTIPVALFNKIIKVWIRKKVRSI